MNMPPQHQWHPRRASQRIPTLTQKTLNNGKDTLRRLKKVIGIGPSEKTMLRKNESSGTRKKLLSATTLQREQFGRHQRKEVARHVSRPSINNSLRNFWGKRKLEKLIGFCFNSIAEIDTPVKEGTSAKYRTRPSASSLAETSPMAKGKTMKT